MMKNKIELWFDRTNDRSEGWFKRQVNWWLIGLGFAVALAVNADTILIFQRLSEDPALREAAVELAQNRVETGAVVVADNAEDGETLEAIRKQVGEAAPFIGWSARDPYISALRNETKYDGLWQGLVKALGLLLTAFAISLGAPFWFDLLQKLVSVRKSVAAGRAKELSKDGEGEARTKAPQGDAAASGEDEEPAYAGPMAGFAPTAATVNLGNAYWLARAASLAYEKDNGKILATLASWGMRGHVFESHDPQVMQFWKGEFASVDTQGFIAADDNAVLVCFRGGEATRPADIVTDLRVALVAAGDCGAGCIHEGFKAAIESVWSDVVAKITELGDRRQPVWFAGHSLGGALAVLAASRYERFVTTENAAAKKAIAQIELDMEPDNQDDATLIGKRQKALARLRGRVAGVYTIGQPRVGDAAFAEDFEARMGESHVRVINNRDVVPRVPLRVMDYRHSGTVLYIDEFGRLHRDPGLWLRLLDTVVISRAEIAKAKEGVQDHSSDAYVDLLEKARKSTSALTRLALS